LGDASVGRPSTGSAHMRVRSPQNERIRELENELYRARETVFMLIGEAACAILTVPHDFESHRAVYDWFEKAIEKIFQSDHSESKSL